MPASPLRDCRTRIVATLGPACDSPRVLGRMLAEGMDVARLNFSHGTVADHRRRVAAVRALAAARGRPVAVLADLQGPKIRIGDTPDGKPLPLRRGDRLTIVAGGRPGPNRSGPPCVTTPFRRLAVDARAGDRILLGDGLVELAVRRVADGRLECEAVTAGVVRPHQGMNLPGARLVVSALTPKDIVDLAAAVRLGADYVALSFVRRGADVLQLRRRLRRLGAAIPIIAKIEKPEALDDLDAILDAADGIMVARGDLGVEISPPKVPVVQKRLIAAANRRGLPVITATQMLESMISNPRPTRAEASDVANAVFDGTDAVMLSGETAMGQYPVEAVATMAAVAREAEAAVRTWPDLPEGAGPDRAIVEAAVDAAHDTGARAIVVFTLSGRTATLVSKFRPPRPVFALTPAPRTYERLALAWGVTPLVTAMTRSTDDMIAVGERELLRGGHLRRGDLAVVIAGDSRHRGATNMMKLHRIGGRG